jgi:hypothetical protein
MRIEAITIYKSQKAAGVSLPFPDRRYSECHEYITCSVQAKIMIAKKMGMTIGGTNQAVMVLILRNFMIRLQRRRAYMDEGQGMSRNH